MRVTTGFNKMLAIPGASIATVSFTPNGIVVGLGRRSKVLRCSCGHITRSVYDRSLRRWRHLDLGATKLTLQAEIRRLWCPACQRVRTKEVPWARPGSRCSRDLEDVVAWLATRADKTTVARLLGISWATVARIITRVIATTIDDARLDGLVRIGVDEVSYRKGHRCSPWSRTTTPAERSSGPGRASLQRPWAASTPSSRPVRAAPSRTP